MSSVLRSVRKRKKGRTLSAVDVIDREGYAELEVDAKVELIRSLIPLGLMHIEGIARRGSDRAGWRTLRPQRPVSRRAPSWEQPRDGRVGRPARADSRAPDSPCHGARDSTGGRTRRCMAIAPSMHLLLRRVLYGISCRNYAAAAEAIPGAIGLSGSTVSRAFIQASATKLRANSRSGTSPGRTLWPSCWTARRSPRRRWSSRWASR